MSNFTDQMSADAQSVVNEFATAISVTPYGSSQRSINAVVNYGIPSQVPGAGGNLLSRDATLDIIRHATLGLLSVNVNGDTFNFPSQIGGSNRDWKAIEILSQDSSMFRIRVR